MLEVYAGGNGIGLRFNETSATLPLFNRKNKVKLFHELAP